jgi:hypothetical protein
MDKIDGTDQAVGKCACASLYMETEVKNAFLEQRGAEDV